MDADVIVIGAGAAGLAAARTLAGRDLRVVVLEARNRIGGRVWTISSTPDGVATELGAEFIHGPAQETMALLREVGTAAVDTRGESWTCRENGDLRRDDEDRMSGTDIFEGASALAQDETVDRFLRRFQDDPAKRETIETARAFVEGFDAGDPTVASAQAIADELRSGVDSFSARPLGGYRPVLEHLHNACLAAGAHVRLSTIVRRISWRRGAVTVDATNGRGEPLTIGARAAIVTLPIGVLRRRGDDTEVVFEPDLLASTRAALRSIEMGDVVKVLLRFRTAFWERIAGGRYRDGAFFRSTGSSFAAYWTQVPIRSELIVAWVGGPRATALRGLSHETLVGRALDGFGAMFGESELTRQEFEEGIMHDWGCDPFARGAYSYIAVGGRDARAALAEPVDDALFFAGEATSNDGQGGTVNGALQTGERAAALAATALSGAK